MIRGKPKARHWYIFIELWEGLSVYGPYLHQQAVDLAVQLPADRTFLVYGDDGASVEVPVRRRGNA